MSLKSRLLTVVIFIFVVSSCLSSVHRRDPKTPQEIVHIFMSAYGTSDVSKLACYTTPYFRNYKPEELWIIETWEKLKEIGYEHISGKILEVRINGEHAVVVVSSRVKTLVGKTQQKEIYCLIKTPEGWKLDEIIVEDEQLLPARQNTASAWSADILA